MIDLFIFASDAPIPVKQTVQSFISYPAVEITSRVLPFLQKGKISSAE